MDKSKEQIAGTFIRFKIPKEFHTKLRVDAITQEPKKNLDALCLEYLKLGYEAAHNGYSGSKVKSSK